ncbi:hypothetical protein [Solilutibacter silvestris]|uniref:Uncharacterized protein n=1 Tax=Solilutibacter silvestris TaxID=1645665 RepID=A0A2K1Q2B0_9GAMM|nr:hypothetical protein [Lysobacter silvestris]PNS09169.1 hypothetical protein Lysil_0798 [Lysobacter silvestris]
MPRLVPLSCACLLALVPLAFTPSVAHAGDWIDLSVTDRDSGSTLPEYRHRGDTWVPGTPGHRYSVRLTNTSGERLLVVLSVDGVNAISGQTATTEQSGYVLEPGQSAEIDGWRKSMQRVAQFVFTDVGDSYAARTGRPDNIGVIGAAVFRERHVRPLPPPITLPMPRPYDNAAKARGEMSSSDAAAPMAESRSAVPQRIGTGHGDSQWSPVDSTTFRRASNRPTEVVSVRYNDIAALRRIGVIPTWRAPINRRPQPFPGGFVPDPPRND